MKIRGLHYLINFLQICKKKKKNRENVDKIESSSTYETRPRLSILCRTVACDTSTATIFMNPTKTNSSGSKQGSWTFDAL